MKGHDEKDFQAQVIEQGNLPAHIALIMDGNGRWARKRGLPRIEGHRNGIRSVDEVVTGCAELGIDVLTLYAFSHENWRRPPREVSALMRLLVRTLRNEFRKMSRNNVQLMAIGHLDDLPEMVRNELAETTEYLKGNTGLMLNLALSYGSRQELTTAVKHIAQGVARGDIAADDVDEMLISSHLDTATIPDPDLLIRTSGEFRISNFMLWQLAYTEIYVTDVLWPEFRKMDLYEAISTYQRRERRFGLVSEQLVQRDQKVPERV